MENSLDVKSLAMLAPLFDFLAEELSAVIWICNNYFNKQLYVSKNIEKIWGIQSQALYEDISQLQDTVLKEDLRRILPDFKPRIIGEPAKKPFAFRILNKSQNISFIKDTHFDLYDRNNNRIAILGIAKPILEQEWLQIVNNQNDYFDPHSKNIKHDIGELVSYYLKTTINSVSKISKRDQFHLLIDNKEIKLTRRQAECLQLLLMGKSAKLIAKDLALSNRTVENYIQLIKSNANCSKITYLLNVIKNRDEIAEWTFD